MRAFDVIKEAMTIVVTLAMLEFTKKFLVETNASSSRLGVVLVTKVI